MMPLLGFSKFKEKLLDGSKTQTIRKPRKHPIKVGDRLFIYWKLRTKECKKLGEATVTKIVRKKPSELTEEDAVKDGFKDKSGLIYGLMEMHGVKRTIDSDKHIHLRLGKKDPLTEVDVITFEWTKKGE